MHFLDFAIGRVNAEMKLQASFVEELFVTDTTPVRLFSCVFALMSFEGVQLSEGFITHPTLVGPVPGVESNMNFVIRGVAERLPTFLTLVRFFPCMYPEVILKVFIFDKGLTTEPAFIRRIGDVNLHMS